MKRKLISLLVIIACAAGGFFGEAAGCSYLASQGGSKSISFGKIDNKSTVRLYGVDTKITSTSNPSDPLIGSWQSIFVGNHGAGTFPATMYDYQLTTETSAGSGVWNLAGGEARIYITAAKPADETAAAKDAYLEATATATTIDFNTGTIYWSTVAINEVNNPFGDRSALSAFTQYATGIFSYTFETSKSLKDWIANPTAYGTTRTSKFATQLSPSSTTAAPEPETWALILVGLGLLSLSLRNKMRMAAFANRNGQGGILPA
ncbi:MAG: PEP-CTERM sorting domain-containing protein [Syntrophales bacterium]